MYDLLSNKILLKLRKESDHYKETIHDSYYVVQIDQRITDLSRINELVTELESEVNESMKIIPSNRKIDYLETRLKKINAEIIFDRSTGEPVVSSAYDEIIKGNNPSIIDLWNTISGHIGRISETDIDGKQYKFSVFHEDECGNGILEHISKGVAFAYHISEIEKKLPNNENKIVKENEIKLEWKGYGSTTELATLIYALAQSKRITIKGNGQPATMKEIKIVFENIFNTSISNVNELIRKSIHSHKKTDGDKLFTEILNDFIKDYKEK